MEMPAVFTYVNDHIELRTTPQALNCVTSQTCSAELDMTFLFAEANAFE